MTTVRLNERRVHSLKPRKSTYDVRDRELKGFGTRGLPSGVVRRVDWTPIGGATC